MKKFILIFTLLFSTPSLSMEEDGKSSEEEVQSPAVLEYTVPEMLQQLAQPPKEGEDKARKELESNFRRFLEQGPDHFIPFQDVLATYLSDILSHGDVTYIYCAPLMKTPSSEFNDKIFQCFVRYLVQKPVSDDDKKRKRHVVDIFVDRWLDYLSEQPGSTFVDLANQFKTTNVYALQKLWLFAAKKLRENPQWQSEPFHPLADMARYFDLPAEVGDTVDTILLRAIEGKTQSVLFIFNFLQTAIKTNLSVSPEIRMRLNELVLWDHEMPLRERSKAFNGQLEVFTEIDSSEETLQSFRRDFESRIKGPVELQIYGGNVFSFLEERQTYRLYALQRRLIQLRADYPELSMPHYLTYLFNVLEEHYMPGPHSETCSNLVTSLYCPVVTTEGTIYGFKLNYGEDGTNKFELYPCDGVSDYPHWSYELPVGQKLKSVSKYTIGPKYVYVLIDHNRIVVLDKTTGDVKEDTDCGLTSPIVHMGTNLGGQLYVVTDEEETKLHVSELNSIVLKEVASNIPSIIGPQYRTEGNYCAISGFSSKVLFYNAEGKSCEIEAGIQEEEVVNTHRPSCTIVGDRVIFDRKLSEDKYQLVCHNLVTNQQEWSQETLPGRLITKPAIGVKKDRVYVVSSGPYIIALDLSGERIWEKNMRDWKNNITGGFVRILPSSDGKTIYWINTHDRFYFRFDALTGGYEVITWEKYAPNRKLIGTSPSGKMYVQKGN